MLLEGIVALHIIRDILNLRFRNSVGVGGGVGVSAGAVVSSGTGALFVPCVSLFFPEHPLRMIAARSTALMVLVNLLFAIFFTLSAAPITAPCILAQDLFPAPNNTVTFPARKNENGKEKRSCHLTTPLLGGTTRI